ncbi:MAG: Ig-like domain-containing protein [Pseudomonadota bacterium]
MFVVKFVNGNTLSGSLDQIVAGLQALSSEYSYGSDADDLLVSIDSWDTQEKYLNGGNGNDTLLAGGQGAIYLLGKEGEDMLVGSSSEANRIFGGEGTDFLKSNLGSVNLLNPGAGVDVAIGTNQGSDYLVHEIALNADAINSQNNIGDLYIGSNSTQDYLIFVAEEDDFIEDANMPGTFIHIFDALDNAGVKEILASNHRVNFQKNPILTTDDRLHLTVINIENVIFDLKPVAVADTLTVNITPLGIMGEDNLLANDLDPNHTANKAKVGDSSFDPDVAPIISQSLIDSDKGLEVLDVYDLLLPDRLTNTRLVADFNGGEIAKFSITDGMGQEAILLVKRNGDVSLTGEAIFGTDEEVHFSYDNFDGFSLASAQATFVLNTPPEAVDDMYMTDEDTVLNIAMPGILFNDNDDDIGDSISVNLPVVSEPSKGILNVHGDGSFSFDPNGEFESLAVGESEHVIFTYQVVDNFNALSNIASVDLEIEGVNDTVSYNIFDSNISDTTFSGGNEDNVNFSIDLLDSTWINDPDTNDTHSLVGNPDAVTLDSIVTPAGVSISSVGVFTLLGRTLSLVVDDRYQVLGAGETATLTFTSRIRDSGADPIVPGPTASSTFDVVVAGVNNRPTLANINVTTNEDATNPFSVDILDTSNDIDSNDVISLNMVSLDSVMKNGMMSMRMIAFAQTAIGISLDPHQFNDLAIGEDVVFKFSATVSDDSGAANDTSLANMVTVTVDGRNDPPNAVDDGFGVGIVTDEDNSINIGNATLLDNDFDPDASDVLTIFSVDDSMAKGTAMLMGGVVVYDPNGQFEELAVGQMDTDTFEYTITDGNGSFDTATVTVKVNGVNDVPLAIPDVNAFVKEDDPTTTDLMGNILDNDSDVDSVLTAQLVSPAAGTYGNLMLQANGDYTYLIDNTLPAVQALNNGDVVFDAFTYELFEDGVPSGVTTTLTLEVIGTAEPPVITPSVIVVDETSKTITLDIDVIADEDSDDLIFGATTVPTGVVVDPTLVNDSDDGVIDGMISTPVDIDYSGAPEDQVSIVEFMSTTTGGPEEKFNVVIGTESEPPENFLHVQFHDTIADTLSLHAIPVSDFPKDIDMASDLELFIAQIPDSFVFAGTLDIENDGDKELIIQVTGTTSTLFYGLQTEFFPTDIDSIVDLSGEFLSTVNALSFNGTIDVNNNGQDDFIAMLSDEINKFYYAFETENFPAEIDSLADLPNEFLVLPAAFSLVGSIDTDGNGDMEMIIQTTNNGHHSFHSLQTENTPIEIRTPLDLPDPFLSIPDLLSYSSTTDIDNDGDNEFIATLSNAGDMLFYAFQTEDTPIDIETVLDLPSEFLNISSPNISGTNINFSIGSIDNGDELSGTADNDIIIALSGNDSIEGSAGDDQLLGGEGNDAFIYTAGGAFGHDTVIDFMLNDTLLFFGFAASVFNVSSNSNDISITVSDDPISGPGGNITMQNLVPELGGGTFNSIMDLIDAGIHIGIQ